MSKASGQSTASIGRRIRQLRESQGLTLKQLGKKTKISKSFLSEIENGVYADIQLSTASEIAKALGATLADVLGLSDQVDAPTGKVA